MFDETQLQYEIVRVYMDREVDNAIAMCRNYINSKHGQVDDDFFQMLENQYDEKELLDSDHNPSIEEHLNITKSPNTTTISEDKKINISVETPKTLAMDSKTLTKSTKTSTEPSQVLKTIQKDEKILLNIKTMETKLNSEYSPTLFTLSPDTKKAFSK